jgi:hypothetical protein
VVRHWGADLGRLDDAGAATSLGALLLPDSAEAAPYAIIPGCGGAEGSGLLGSHDGGSTRPTFADVQTRLLSGSELAPGLTETGAETVVVTGECAVSGLCLDVAIQLTANGVVRCRAGLTNRASERYRLEGLRLVLPAGGSATHLVELEDRPPRLVPLRPGALAAPDPAGRARQVVVAEAAAGYQRGGVWQAHVAFSGAVTHAVEVTGGRTYLGGGDRLVPGEVVLGRGEAYHSPWVLWTWGDGLDDAAARLHAEQRAAGPATVPVIFDATARPSPGTPRAMLRLAEYAGRRRWRPFPLDLSGATRRARPFTPTTSPSRDAATPDTWPPAAGSATSIFEVGLALGVEALEPRVVDHPGPSGVAARGRAVRAPSSWCSTCRSGPPVGYCGSG